MPPEPNELAEAHCMGLHDVEPHPECQMCKEHEYHFAADNAWEILHFVHMNMAKGDFYGHTLHSCIEVHLAELVGEPTGSAIWV